MRLLGEARQGGLNHQESPAEGGPRGEMLQEGVWLAALQGVKGEGEVGQRCEEGRGGGRWHGDGMQG